MSGLFVLVLFDGVFVFSLHSPFLTFLHHICVYPAVAAPFFCAPIGASSTPN